MSAATALRTVILGSCVSRDTFGHLDPARYTLGAYVARQSLATLRRPPGPSAVDTARIASPFQRRVTEGSLRGDAVERLRAAGEVRLVLIDLTDERLGVIELGDDRLVTRSVELIAGGLDRELRERHPVHAFGSAEHFAWWRDGWDLLRDVLIAEDLLRRTLVIAPPWASASEDGTATPRSYGVGAEEFSGTAAAYVDVLRSSLSAGQIIGEGLAVRSSPAHQWGDAPFHYSTQTYRELCTAIDAATTGM